MQKSKYLITSGSGEKLRISGKTEEQISGERCFVSLRLRLSPLRKFSSKLKINLSRKSFPDKFRNANVETHLQEFPFQ